MLSDYLWSIMLRTGQVAIESSPTLVIGFFISAVLRVMLGCPGTRRLFGGENLRGLFRAWVIGSLLPVCSLGVVPIARELLRAGVPSATILAFLLAAPQLNPLSLLYGLTLSEPVIIVVFVIATMVIAVLGGEIWKRVFERPDDSQLAADEATPAPGVKRIIAVLVAACREAVSPAMIYVLIGIVITGLLTGLIPHGALSTSMRHDNWTSPELMALIGLPSYSGVLQGMMRIGLMFDHGNSVGASFMLFEIGVGMNLGLVVYLVIHYSWRRVLLWLATIVALALAIAHAIENPLYFAREDAGHTHAFDDWSNPFPDGYSPSWEVVRGKLLQKIEVLEPIALVILALLLLCGGVLARFDPSRRLEAWLVQSPPPLAGPPSIWNRAVPGPILGLCILLGLVLFSIIALYIYYPDTQQGFDEITRVRADAIAAIRTGKKEEAIRQ
ncbi:MAG: permease, partial [Candidatus Bilamarchaeaceae archaeon]